MIRFSTLFLIFILTACNQQQQVEDFEQSQQLDTMKLTIIISENASKPVKISANDLKMDLNRVLSTQVQITTDNLTLPNSQYYIVLGQLNNLLKSPYISDSDKNIIQSDTPKARGGLIRHIKINHQPAVLLTGRDIQGTQYMVYDYSEQVLGIDKLTYWTGGQPAQIELAQIINFHNQSIAPPIVPLLVYFENDVDELANLKKPYLEYDWQSFTQMIDALVKLRYNGIEFFDMLGRVEFYTRPEYLQMHPNYQLNVEYLNKMIDYVHDKGMYVQIDMMMGRQLLNLSEEASTCWRDHKQEWINTWHHYLTKTPVAKADIFALRPRNQVWDWEYKSSCGEDKAEVFNEVYASLENVIDQYKPNATKVCTCYHDGMEIFNQNFNPPKSFIIAWSDNGWGEFDYLPKNTKGYQFGTYMHAGFWLNHDVADPYPELIDQTMDMMYDRFQATEYMMVNGQTFRPFLLNLEAFSESARLGIDFDGQKFYKHWASRYFGSNNATDIVKSLKLLHKAHEDHVGYVEILWQIKKMTAYLTDTPLQRPGLSSVAVEYNSITEFFTGTEQRINALLEAQNLVKKVQTNLKQNQIFFHDYISLPIQLYLDLLKYNQNLIELSKLKAGLTPENKIQQEPAINQILVEAELNLENIYHRRSTGDLNPKWKTWYAPQKRRPNNGFPNSNSVNQIRQSLLGIGSS
ncbi:glycosyl hydrolase 115 family protein [Catenovulum sp. 2E275]|uniref:glycosyl hydrolase 115 family protein n=1 Tax=Catenovulum sp. 2E275 TaxID=2980497 RepID=UPI0021D3280A|nr:glycosyl hydrolase 115 family protein [Catenovulum sp. 2E275]MCU4675260.1 glycosyl hydrolase 115 family protein [Catenovulum sp. 2E275]